MKTIVLTGVTSGIGKALYQALLAHDYHVIGVGRQQAKLDALHEETNQQGTLLKADFTDFKTVDALIDTIKHRYPNGIDALINNAAMVPKACKKTVDGFERQYQVNHLVVAKLSLALLPLVKMKNGMIITTASNAHKRAKFAIDDIEALNKYHTLRSYMRTKLYNIMFTSILRTVYDVKAYAVHPGLIKTGIGTKDTSRLYAWLWRLFTRRGKDPQTAVQTYLYLLTALDAKALYYYRLAPESTAPAINNTRFLKVLHEQTLQDLNIKKALD